MERHEVLPFANFQLWRMLRLNTVESLRHNKHVDLIKLKLFYTVVRLHEAMENVQKEGIADWEEASAYWALSKLGASFEWTVIVDSKPSIK